MASALGLLVWCAQGGGIVGVLALSAILLLSSFVAWGGGICLVRDSHIRASRRESSKSKVGTV